MIQKSRRRLNHSIRRTVGRMGPRKKGALHMSRRHECEVNKNKIQDVHFYESLVSFKDIVNKESFYLCLASGIKCVIKKLVISF